MQASNAIKSLPHILVQMQLRHPRHSGSDGHEHVPRLASAADSDHSVVDRSSIEFRAGPNFLAVANGVDVRGFLDACSSLSPYQEPELFDDPRAGEEKRQTYYIGINDDRCVFFARGTRYPVFGRLVPGFFGLEIWRGPAFADRSTFALGLKFVEDTCRSQHLVQVRISPQAPISVHSWLGECCEALGWSKLSAAPSRSTLIVDLADSVDQLFARLQKKTRYDVRRSLRMGLRVRPAVSRFDLASFFEVYRSRSEQKRFSGVGKEEFLLLGERLLANPRLGVILISEMGEQLAGGAVILRSGTTAHYTYGAINTLTAGTMPVSHALIWEAIVWARNCGCSHFDLGGFGSAGDSGVRHFKAGFGGSYVEFPPFYGKNFRSVVGRCARLLKGRG